MIKRFAFLVFVCFLLAGCVSDPGQVNPTDTESIGTEPTTVEFVASESMREYNAQNKFRGIAPRVTSFQETESFFCGSGFMGEVIHYYDKASGVSGVLCADPSCTHESSACGAYADYGSFFCDKEGTCYWVGKDDQGEGRDYYLWTGDLAGTNQKKVKRLSFEDIIVQYQPQQYEIHRGRFYILGQNDIVDGVNTYQRVILLSSALDGAEKYATLFDKTFDLNVHPFLRFIGDSVYLTLQVFPNGGPFDVTILKINVKTGDVETLYEESGMTESIDPVWVTEKGEIFIPGRNEENAFVWKLESGKRVEISRWEYSEPSCPSIFDGIAVFTYRVDGVRWVDIINLSGESLYSGKLFQKEILGMDSDPNKCSLALIGGDNEKLILNLQNFTETGLIDYTIMLDLKENLKPTILWSTQQ